MNALGAIDCAIEVVGQVLDGLLEMVHVILLHSLLFLLQDLRFMFGHADQFHVA